MRGWAYRIPAGSAARAAGGGAGLLWVIRPSLGGRDPAAAGAGRGQVGGEERDRCGRGRGGEPVCAATTWAEMGRGRPGLQEGSSWGKRPPPCLPKKELENADIAVMPKS